MNPLLLHEAFFAAAARFPGRVAVWRGVESVTFDELATQTKQVARALAAKGVGRTDRLAWWGDTRLDLVPLFLACASLGVTFTPVNPGFTADEAQAVLDVAEPVLLVVDDEHEGDVQLSDLTHSAVTGGLDAYETREIDGHVMFFTSGTTGKPKAIELSHRTSMLRALSAMSEFPRGPLVCMFPLFHMSGWSSAISPWLSGEEVVLADGSNAEDLVRAIQRHRAQRFYALPAVWRRILDLDLRQFDLRSLEHADTGTSATTVELLTEIHDALPQTSTTVIYGSTEASGVCRLGFEDLQRKPGSVGLPVPGVLVRLEDQELWVRSPFIFGGYFRNPEATEAALVDGWYRTGDLARIDDEGYVSIVGRRSDMIRTGGEYVAPAEVDGVVQDHPAVLDGAVTGVPDENWGEIVTAFVVVRPGSSLTLDELRRHCEAHLAGYKVPRQLVLVDSIPRTGATRQVQRRHLKKPD
jgi:acyl-CoA synthetase (AMP-forming)/AMP-acid ligase II